MHDAVGKFRMGLIVDRTDCGRGIRAPTNPLWGLGLQDIDVIFFLGTAGRGALSAPAISQQGFSTFTLPQFANSIVNYGTRYCISSSTCGDKPIHLELAGVWPC